jgi:hypothetical protein
MEVDRGRRRRNHRGRPKDLEIFEEQSRMQATKPLPFVFAMFAESETMRAIHTHSWRWTKAWSGIGTLLAMQQVHDRAPLARRAPAFVDD